MTEHEATRTLVKSPPELWAECSDAGSLARHLAESFGEIRVTRLEPERTVAWEGERVSGTVRIEPSAWGTRVTLTAQMIDEAAPEAAPDDVTGVIVEEAGDAVGEEPVALEEPVVVEDPEPAAEDQPVTRQGAPAASELPRAPEAKLGFVARVRAYFKSAPPAHATAAVDAPELPGIDSPPEPEPEPREAKAPSEPEVVAVEAEEAHVAVAAPEPEPDPEPEPEPEPEPGPPSLSEQAVDPEAVLTAALDSLGRAHHRPFSRA